MPKRAMTDAAKKEKANAILDMAAEMFLQSDYDKVRMSEIAKSMGISNGILFVYFKSKETLFMQLLFREYQNRFKKIRNRIKVANISTNERFKKFILDDLSEIADENSLYIRLEVLRSLILEKNIDKEFMIKFKLAISEKFLEIVNAISEKCPLTASEITEVINAELSIVAGCKLNTTLPQSILDIIDEYNMGYFKHDFRTEVLKTMERYLDGFLSAIN